MYRILNIAQSDFELQKKFSQHLGISPFLAQLLINRGIETPEEAHEFLEPSFHKLDSPFRLTDMEIACHRIREAIKHKEKVMIFGDYDVDGISGVAILKLTLDSLGIRTFCYLPHRINEGYGLSPSIVKIAKENDIGLLITVDCGITNFLEVEHLMREGIDVIITDHHLLVDDKLPPALAVINPRRENYKSGFKELAGVGVVYKLASALLGRYMPEYLDLVCLGTVADSVPLLGENRIMVKKGLEILTQTKRPGLLALKDISGLKENKVLDTFDIAYILAPRLNASGRIDTAHLSLKLLTTILKSEAEDLAVKLNRLNSNRQQIEEKILKEAKELIEQGVNFKESKVIILAKEGWHEGVLGIIASRIKDMFYRPTVMISLKDSLCRGSARSIEKFHIMEALWECRDILENFGGHRLAAGLSINKENIDNFKERLNQLANRYLSGEDMLPCLNIDMELSFAELGRGILEEIQLLKPFGEMNPEPLFYTPSLKLRSEPLILGNGTLKIWVSDGNFTYPAIGFGMGDLKEYLKMAECFDLVYSVVPARDRYLDLSEFELRIEDIRMGPLK